MLHSVVFYPRRLACQTLVANSCFLHAPWWILCSWCQENSQCCRHVSAHPNTPFGSYWTPFFHDGKTGSWYIQPRSTLLRLFGCWGWSWWSWWSRIVVDKFFVTIASIIITVLLQVRTAKVQKYWLNYAKRKHTNEVKMKKAVGKKYQTLRRFPE